MSCMASFATTKSRFDGATWPSLLVAHSIRVSERTLTLRLRTLAMDVPHHRTKPCTPGLSLTGNDRTHRKLFHMAAFCNPAHHRTPMPANTCPPAPPTRPRSTLETSLRTRRSGGGQQKQKRNRELRRQQPAANLIHLLEEGDRRSPRTRNHRHRQDQVQSNRDRHRLPR